MGVEVVVGQEVTTQVMEGHQELLHRLRPPILHSHSMVGTQLHLHRDTHRARPHMQHHQLTVPHRHSKVAKALPMVAMGSRHQHKPLPSHPLAVLDTVAMADNHTVMNKTVITILEVMDRHLQAIMVVIRVVLMVVSLVQTTLLHHPREIMEGHHHKEVMVVGLPLREIMGVAHPQGETLGDSQDMVVHHPPMEVTRDKVVDTTRVAVEATGVAGLMVAAAVVIDLGESLIW